MKSDCQHKLLKKQLSGGFSWYKCVECGQKFKVQEWDGKMRVTNAKNA